MTEWMFSYWPLLPGPRRRISEILGVPGPRRVWNQVQRMPEGYVHSGGSSRCVCRKPRRCRPRFEDDVKYLFLWLMVTIKTRVVRLCSLIGGHGSGRAWFHPHQALFSGRNEEHKLSGEAGDDFFFPPSPPLRLRVAII